MGRLLLAVAVYGGMAAGVWASLGNFNLPTFRRLAVDGVPAAATVTAPDCGNHASVRYTFDAGGRRVDGVGQPGDGNPPCERLRAGDRLAVWYLPADPAVSRPGDPVARLRNEQVSVGLAAAALPGFLLAVVAVAVHRLPTARAVNCGNPGRQDH